MHQHSHTHSHHAHDGGMNFNKAFAVGIILNVLYVLTEAGYGFHINSLALLSDAGHNLSDVLGLILAWTAEYLVSKKAFGQFTYGLKRSSILIALINTLLLLFAMGAISWEAIERLGTPVPAPGFTMSLVAFAGIIVNGFTAFLFYSNSKDINIQSTFWHMASDALVSAGVVIAGIVLHFKQWTWIDPAISLIIVVIIIASTFRLLMDSLRLILDAAPKTIEIPEVKSFLSSLPGVKDIHDLHIWNLSTRQTAMTVHLIIPEYIPDDHFLKNLEHELHHRYEISHSTIQIEKGTQGCLLERQEC